VRFSRSSGDLHVIVQGRTETVLVDGEVAVDALHAHYLDLIAPRLKVDGRGREGRAGCPRSPRPRSAAIQFSVQGVVEEVGLLAWRNLSHLALQCPLRGEVTDSSCAGDHASYPAKR